MKTLRKAVLNAISEGKDIKEVNTPKSPYKPAEEWQIPRALEFLNKYYSDFKNNVHPSKKIKKE